MDDRFDLVVIGSGPGGYVASIRAAQLGLKTASVEKYSVLGGACLNVGCIPSKTLLHSSELYATFLNHGKEHGIEGEFSLSFAQMMKKKEEVVRSFNLGIETLFKKNQITRLIGEASFISPRTLLVGGKKIAAAHFILATGSKPIPLPFLPFDEKHVLSSTGALALKNIPKKMIVVGGGIIGVELGSVYARLGTEVHIVEFLDRICPTLDRSLSKALEASLKKQGLFFHLGSKVTKGELSSSPTLTIEKGDQSQERLSAEVILVSIGRRPYTDGLNLEKIGIGKDQKGFVQINSAFQTSHSHIYAIGDLVDGPMLAHKASEEGRVVAELIAGKKVLPIDYIAIPNVVYTSPEVASVGLSEEEARTMNLSIKTAQFPMKANSRARAIQEEEGFVKLILEEKSGVIIGYHIFSSHASELIAECTFALKKKVTAFELGDLCHPHPTLSEAIKEAALMLSKKALHL